MSVMLELKPLLLQDGDVLYHYQDHAQEIYFIELGKI
jgi:hypothetical protein